VYRPQSTAWNWPGHLPCSVAEREYPVVGSWLL
jgi:hypothetical protein